MNPTIGVTVRMKATMTRLPVEVAFDAEELTSSAGTALLTGLTPTPVTTATLSASLITTPSVVRRLTESRQNTGLELPDSRRASHLAE